MARKLNKNVVGILTFVGMVLIAVIGIVLVANLPGQDPDKYAADAKRLEDSKQWEKARKTYRRAYQKDPNKNPEYMVSSARCSVEEGSLGEAMAALQEARMRNPNLKSALTMSVELELELAEMYGGSRRWHTVLDSATKLQAQDEDSLLVQRAIGEAYLQLREEDSKYEEKGEAALKRAWELDPTNEDVVRNLASLDWAKSRKMVKDGRQRDADALRDQILVLIDTSIKRCEEREGDCDDAPLRRIRATYRIMSGDVERGMAELNEMAASESTSAATLVLLARLHTGAISNKVEANFELAEKTLLKAIEVEPSDGQIYELLGRVYKSLRDGAQDESKKAEYVQKEAETYEMGLRNVERTEHFRHIANNMHRVEFFTELCLRAIDDAHSAAGDDAKKAESLADAEKWIEEMKGELDLEDPVIRYLSAHVLNVRSEYIAAIKEAEAALKTIRGGQGRFRVLVLLGELYRKQQQWGSAREALEEALRLRPQLAPLQVQLGYVYLRLDQPNKALMLLKPTRPVALRDYMDRDRRAKELRVEAYRQLGQLAKAEEESRLLGESSPQDLIRQIKLKLLDNQLAEAEQLINQFQAKDPDNFEVISLRLRLLRKAGRVEEGDAYIQSLLAKRPDDRELRRMSLQWKSSSGEGSEEQMLEFLKEEPDPYVRAVSLASFHLNRKEYDAAVKYLDEAEALRPDEAVIIDRQFRCAMVMKDWKRAERYVARDTQLNLDGTEGKLAQGRLALSRGIDYSAQGQSDKAGAEFQRAIDLITLALQKYSTNSLGWTYLAEAYLAVGRTSEAKDVLNTAIAKDPTNGYANRALAQIAMKEGDEEAAKKYLTAAAKYLPDDEEVERQLRMFKEKENPTEGIATREKIRIADPKNVENLLLLARLYAQEDVAEYDKAADAYLAALECSGKDISIARETAMFLGRPAVNRPQEGEKLLEDMMKAEEQDKAKQALLAVYLGQFYETQNILVRAGRHFRLAVNYDPSPTVLTYAAEFCTRTNHLADAMEYYERVKDTPGVDRNAARTARLRIIALLLTVNDMDAAKKAIDEFLRDFTDDPEGMVYLGAYHRLAGDIQEAKKAFDRHLERSPDNAMALWQRGQMFLLMGRYGAAIADLQKAKAYQPNAFLYQHRIALAEALLESGKNIEAVTELKQILDERPAEFTVAEALVSVYSRTQPPQYVEAENLIFTYMRQYPKEFRWPRLLGRLGEMSQDWSKAVRGYEKAAELVGYEPQAALDLFRSLQKANRPADVITFATDKVPSKALSASPELLAIAAWAYSRSGDEEKSLQVFDDALAAAGDDFTVYTNVVNEMVRVLGSPAALARAKARTEADPSDLNKKKTLVHLLSVNGKFDEALAVCRQIGESATSNADSVFAAVGQGVLLEALGRHSDARDLYEAALKLDAQNRTALNNLAYLLADKLDNAKEALPYAEQAKRLDPNNANTLDTVGWIQAKNGLYGEAIGTLLRAHEIDRENVEVLYHLGMAHKLRGEREEALFRLGEAKRLASQAQADSPILPKIEEALNEL